MSEEQGVTTQVPVTITTKAAERLKEIMKDDGKNPEKDSLRVFVQGGGCSGFQYGLMLSEDPPSENDKQYESNGIKIIVDPVSIIYLNGAVVNFTEGPDSPGGFVVQNPNATSTCGCGQSFKTD